MRSLSAHAKCIGKLSRGKHALSLSAFRRHGRAHEVRNLSTSAAESSDSPQVKSVEVNGRSYRVPSPDRPLVGICLDGSQQEYIDKASQNGRMPFWSSRLHQDAPLAKTKGLHGIACSVMPSFTNPNNVSIITGALPDVHGVSGNYFFDKDSGEEVMMNDAKFIRCPTIFESFDNAGVSTLVITAKTKLLNLLGKGLSDKSLAVSIEELSTGKESRSSESLKRHGLFDLVKQMDRPPPSIYDADSSIFALDLGARILQSAQSSKSSGNAPSFSPAVAYLSTTDFVQHKNAPGSQAADDFYAAVDTSIMQLAEKCGARVGLTADHGMNPKLALDGGPNVVYLSDILSKLGIPGRVILSITDPYVVHHGALGSFATIYVDKEADARPLMEQLRQTRGVYSAIGQEDACRELNLPTDRVGDIIVLGDQHTVLGKSPKDHDLTQIDSLRSHGGLEEIKVPMFFSHRLSSDYTKRLTKGNARNFDLFEMLCNGVEA